MINYKLGKEVCLFDGTKISIGINIPLSQKDTTEREDEWMNGVLIDQIVNGFNSAKDAYDNSPLPNKYLNHTRFIVLNSLENLTEANMRPNDDIILDADGISGIGSKSEYVFGHEMGHKIIRHIDRKEALRDIADILVVSQDYEALLEEIFANECGNIVNKSSYDFVVPMSQAKRQGVQRRVLANIYRG